MKKVFLIAICSVVFSASLFANSSWVSAKKVEIKSGRDWFAKTVATASYGDEVDVITENGDWVKVTLASDKSKTGWIPSASVTKKKIVASNGKVSANAKEISLAGKGFSSSLEDSDSGNAKADYKQVDAMEKLSVSNEEAKNFLKDGSLKLSE